MKIDMTIRHGVGGPELRSFIRDGMEKALGRFVGWVNRVEVRLDDVNGPRGGQDKRCWIQVDVDGKGPIQVSTLSDTAATASTQAIQKLKARLRRVLDTRGRR